MVEDPVQSRMMRKDFLKAPHKYLYNALPQIVPWAHSWTKCAQQWPYIPGSPKMLPVFCHNQIMSPFILKIVLVWMINYIAILFKVILVKPWNLKCDQVLLGHKCEMKKGGIPDEIRVLDERGKIWMSARNPQCLQGIFFWVMGWIVSLPPDRLIC